MKKILSIVCLSAACQAGAQEIEEIVVKAHPLSEQGLAQSTIVLRGDELAENLQSSLGETVAGSPGIRSASFGGAVGRPVIHGLGGARVKTTEDRIDSLDVSVTSGDHAVTVEPFIADQITVLKGASTLLYGAGAIGGVVDTETGRIPTEVPEAPISGRAELRAGDNADTRTGAVRLDGRLSDAVAWHLDAFSKEADDYEVPGEVESRALRASEGESLEDGESQLLPGSRYSIDGGALGVSWVSEVGMIGVSVSKLNSDYGLIGGHNHEHDDDHDDHDDDHDDHDDDHDDHDDDHDDHDDDHDEHDDDHDEEFELDDVGRIDLEQTRVDIEAQLNDPLRGIESLNLRVGINDYQHKEIEASGEVGTLFDNQAWEARLEAKHVAIGGWSGVLGVQLNDRDFSALGEEAFVPPVNTSASGLFWVGENNYSGFSVEGGVRVERVEHDPETSLSEREYNTTSASLGVVVPQSDALTWSALLDYTERAPSIEELYSNGAHLATQTFVIGDVDLETESGAGVTLSTNYESDLFDVRASVYHTRFNDFIYQANTGLIDDELPVFAYRQVDAAFTGLDLELGVHVGHFASGDLDVTAMFDTVNADLESGSGNSEQALPRIPSDRLGVGLAWSGDAFSAKLNYTYVAAQRDVAILELPTESYTDISARLSYRMDVSSTEVTVFLQGRNLGDEEQRNHTSFIKDLAPAAGRRIEAGLRFLF
ncbi:TonB-dependent receptor [Arenicella xantha]|uniref:Iron complex outermembrane receptor protein n=1 Tax=Arenicella xantha TaxID=644221 RepID=A0A395JHJ2_9GAMM|nr:TonB-dependent receptor [Arenicella xantha]RBP48925.1 iron complex outermembrane receptor protein [Arenicella xantha]